MEEYEFPKSEKPYLCLHPPPAVPTAKLEIQRPTSTTLPPWTPGLTACELSISEMDWSYCSARIASLRVCSSLSRLRRLLC